MKVLCLVLLFSTPIAGQPWLFYNVENLFDTIHDRNFHDLEFTPAGSKKYGSITYRLCIRQTSRVLHMLQQSHYRAPIVALCEVENRSVLDDLIRHQGMRVHGPWNIVHFDSPDYRGIDCAVLYNPERIQVLQTDRIRYSNDTLLTRDALFVRYTIDEKRFNLVVVHLPSKRGGSRESQWKRNLAISAVLTALDSCISPTIIMGDFNDPLTQEYGPSWHSAIQIGTSGTYKYQGRWNAIDGGIANFPVQVQACDLPLLLQKDAKWGGLKPLRRWQGNFYKNGFSDHLPVHFSEVVGIGK